MCLRNYIISLCNLAHEIEIFKKAFVLLLQCVDMWKQNSCQLTTPAEIDVSSYTNTYSHTPTCLSRFTSSSCEISWYIKIIIKNVSSMSVLFLFTITLSYYLNRVNE